MSRTVSAAASDSVATSTSGTGAWSASSAAAEEDSDACCPYALAPMATTVMTTRHLNTVGTLTDTLAEEKLKLKPILLELTERFSPLKAGGCENSFALFRNSNLSVLRRTVAHVMIGENDV